MIITIAAITADLWVPQLFGDPSSDRHAKPPRRSAPAALRWSTRWAPTTWAATSSDASIYGARVSLTVGVLAVGIEVLIGLILGAISGFYGTAIDAFIMRMTDIFLAFPYILFASSCWRCSRHRSEGSGPSFSPSVFSAGRASRASSAARSCR